ncbi:MAG: metallophosphoesterase [Treponema sp.]|nr:metallophosphoesterase [Treponema sp.]
MNKLELFNNMFTTEEELEKLAHKDKARILTVSDSHGMVDSLRNIVFKYGKECDALIHCGDGIQDLIRLIENSFFLKTMQEFLPPVIVFVKGNCDASSFSYQNPGKSFMLKKSGPFIIPPNQIITVNEKKLLIVHGHNQGINYGFEKLGLETKLLECSTALYGHTHIASDRTIDDIRFINPGSCSSPRDGQTPGFAILTIEKNFIDAAFLRQKKYKSSSEYEIYTPLC